MSELAPNVTEGKLICPSGRAEADLRLVDEVLKNETIIFVLTSIA